MKINHIQRFFLGFCATLLFLTACAKLVQIFMDPAAVRAPDPIVHQFQTGVFLLMVATIEFVIVALIVGNTPLSTKYLSITIISICFGVYRYAAFASGKINCSCMGLWSQKYPILSQLLLLSLVVMLTGGLAGLCWSIMKERRRPMNLQEAAR